MGDGPSAVREAAREAVKLDTFGGTVYVEWDPDAAATPLGHLAFFAEYLKVSGRFDALVAGCPLQYTSPNAPTKPDILGTPMLSILAALADQTVGRIVSVGGTSRNFASASLGSLSL